MFPLTKEITSKVILILLIVITLGVTYYYGIVVVGWLSILCLVDLYILFYTKEYEHIRSYCLVQIGIFLLLWILIRIMGEGFLLFPIAFFPVMYLLILWLHRRRKPVLYVGVVGFALLFFYLGQRGYGIVMQGATLVLLTLLESLYHGLSRNFIKNTAEFQNQIMLHHYEEVKSVYLNMRGWRHDYHNHIQSIKAYLSLQQYDCVEDYLQELELDLKKVDHLIRSGNLMVDAILNSKLTLAGNRNIPVVCKVMVPEHLSISEVDLCVMLGNLLDNAMEACEPLEEEKRFIRIYSDIVHSQFYFSILNSAAEDLSFQQKNYISDKRGEHGHGMKRVKLTVDKYDGYLNLKNEPGVFASEIMIPL
jgi:sensor histidine kinase YesM